ncbi:MAG: hypothetical protein ACOC9Y_00740 [Chloroflexota bacterium]
MQVEEVHFNHNTGSASDDAINIRRDETPGSKIEAPEWTLGQTPQPACYAIAAIGKQVTIRARFRDGPRSGSRKIRAVDADLPFDRPAGCLGFLINLILMLIRALTGNVLGDVKEQMVTFDESGRSALTTFELVNHRIKKSGVAIRTTRWKWQVLEGGSWVDFDTTQHRIFIVLDMPRGPWQQNAGGDNIQLPWVSALEKACSWAVIAQTKDEAAAKITRAINSALQQSYNPATFFGYTTYNLSFYLDELDSGSPFSLNCTDCANAVTTMANLLGCDLWEGQFTWIFTREIVGVGGDPGNPGDWVTWNWSYHEIAWLDSTTPDSYIYDACLHIDMDDDYDDSVHIPRLPVKMRFGTPDQDYLYRLMESGNGTIENVPRRRPVA